MYQISNIRFILNYFYKYRFNCMKKFIYILGVIVFCSEAAAKSDWLEMGRTDEFNYFINVPSVKNINVYGKPIIQAWIKMEIYNDITKDGLSVGDYSLLLYHINCEDETIGLKSSTDYKSNGKTLGRSLNYTSVEMKDVIPNSIGQGILSYGCAAIEYKNSK